MELPDYNQACLTVPPHTSLEIWMEKSKRKEVEAKQKLEYMLVKSSIMPLNLDKMYETNSSCF